MQLTSVKRTALFKNEGKNIMVLKLSLPKALPTCEDEQFCERFNCFYSDLTEECIAVCKKLSETGGAQILNKCPYPIILSIDWERVSKSPVARRKERCDLIYIQRTVTLSSLGKSILKRELCDAFDIGHGYLIK